MRVDRRLRPALLAVAAVAALSPIAGPARAATETDVALHAPTTATVLGAPARTCSATSGPDRAVDGAFSNIYTDKWCVPSGQPTLTINLTGNAYGYTVSHIVVRHAGAAGESATYNTRAFRLRVVKAGQATPITVDTQTANTASVTSSTVNLANVASVQLLIDLPTQSTAVVGATRIYEVEVWGVPTTTRPPAGTCLLTGQKLVNPGFEVTTGLPWVASPGVIGPDGDTTPHTGARDAYLDGYGTTHTDTLAQTVVVPAGCSAGLSFWLFIDTTETSTTIAFDTLTVKINGTTIGSYSNLNHATTWIQRSFDISKYAGLTVTVLFTGGEDGSNQTGFHIDDTSLIAS